MIQKMSTPISVDLRFDHKTRIAGPIKLLFEGRPLVVEKIGLHHTFRAGRELFHVFSVVAGGTFFRLVLDTTNLSWKLEEVADGEAD